MKLLQLYKSILESTGVVVGDAGELSLPDGNGGTEQMSLTYVHDSFGEVKGKMFLPTGVLMAKPEDKNVVKFHPAGESVLRGRSAVFNRLHSLIIQRLRYVFIGLSNVIFEVACRQDHSNISVSAMEYLEGISGNIKDNQIAYWKRLQRVIMTDMTKVLSIRISRGGATEAGRRTATLTVKILAEMETEKPFGVKPPSVQAKENAAAIFDNLSLDDVYTSDVNSPDMPYLLSLLGVYTKVARHFNAVYTAFEACHDIDPSLKTDISWAKHIKKLPDMFNAELPLTLPGNKGVDPDACNESSLAPIDNSPPKPSVKIAAAISLPVDHSHMETTGGISTSTDETLDLSGGEPLMPQAGYAQQAQQPAQQVDSSVNFLRRANANRNMPPQMQYQQPMQYQQTAYQQPVQQPVQYGHQQLQQSAYQQPTQQPVQYGQQPLQQSAYQQPQQPIQYGQQPAQQPVQYQQQQQLLTPTNQQGIFTNANGQFVNASGQVIA